MTITPAMIAAARTAELAFYQGSGSPGERFIGMPDAVIRAMLEAALAIVPDPTPEAHLESRPRFSADDADDRQSER